MIQRRIKKEIKMINDKFNLNLHLDCNDINANVNVFLKEINKECVIKYNKDYPFNPCKIFLMIDNKEINYIDYFKMQHNKILNYCNKNVLSLSCPCCFNLYCKWKVSNTSLNMLDEIVVKYKIYNTLETRLYAFIYLIKLFNEKYLKNIHNVILTIVKYI